MLWLAKRRQKVFRKRADSLSQGRRDDLANGACLLDGGGLYNSRRVYDSGRFCADCLFPLHRDCLTRLCGRSNELGFRDLEKACQPVSM